VREDQLVAARDPRECGCSRPDVDALVLRRQRLAPLQEGIAPECDYDAHLVTHLATSQSPRVATMTALIVCSRFSAWSKTIECSDSKTSSVTSRPSMPYSW